ncbi:MAG: outer membrane beta-barrel protein, partial [Bacteroidota bacterium]|nr:outer membrane beta-barrel protein [Bacteroidota bacterium]
MKKICFSCIIILLTMGQAPFSMADGDFTFNPSLQFRGEYDDNINFDNDNENSDWLGVFIPSLKASLNTPRLDVNGSAEAEIRRFANKSQYNDEYQRCKINGSYQLIERLTLDAGASYTKDSTLDSELEETGIVENLYGRKRYTLNTGAHYQLGERVSTSLNYSYGNTSYDSPEDTDYDSNGIVGSISYLFRNQRNQVFLQPAYYHYNSDISKVDNYGLSLGWNRSLSEKLTLSCYLGLRYTDTEYNYHYYVPVFAPDNNTITWQKRKETISEDDFGGTADISLSGKTETLNYKISYNHDLTYTSSGSPIDRDRFIASINWNINQRLRSGLGTGLYFAKANDNYSDEDSIYFYLHPHISYRLMKNHYLQL